MSNQEQVAISLRPPGGMATPEFGPLIRAQPVRMAREWPLRVTPPILGVAVANLMRHADAAAVEIALVGTLLGIGWSIPRAQSWWRRHRLNRCPAWDGAGPPPGGVVRVTGRLRALGEPFLPPGESQPVVYCRTRFPQANSHGKYSYSHREDIRGLFLEIDLSAHASVRIAPESVRVLDGEAVVPEVGREVRWKLGAPWEGWWQGKLRRSILRAGDMVEAAGEVAREVNAQGAASPGRGVPMIQWMIPAWPGGVWMRRLEPP
jgi:hypothetical protein